MPRIARYLHEHAGGSGPAYAPCDSALLPPGEGRAVPGLAVCRAPSLPVAWSSARLPPEARCQREDVQAELTHHEDKPCTRHLDRSESKEGEIREHARAKDAARPEEYVHRRQSRATLLDPGAAATLLDPGGARFLPTRERQPRPSNSKRSSSSSPRSANRSATRRLSARRRHGPSTRPSRTSASGGRARATATSSAGVRRAERSSRKGRLF